MVKGVSRANPFGCPPAVTDVSVVRVERQVMIRLIHERSIFSERFMVHLLPRNVRIERPGGPALARKGRPNR